MPKKSHRHEITYFLLTESKLSPDGLKHNPLTKPLKQQININFSVHSYTCILSCLIGDNTCDIKLVQKSKVQKSK